MVGSVSAATTILKRQWALLFLFPNKENGINARVCWSSRAGEGRDEKTDGDVNDPGETPPHKVNLASGMLQNPIGAETSTKLNRDLKVEPAP